jgi:hypothetical protein
MCNFRRPGSKPTVDFRLLESAVLKQADGKLILFVCPSVQTPSKTAAAAAVLFFVIQLFFFLFLVCPELFTFMRTYI